METVGGEKYKYVDKLYLSKHGGMIRFEVKAGADARVSLQPCHTDDGLIEE